MMMTAPLNIIITGGKTGGHLFPGIATAMAIRSISPGAGILFAGTDAPFEIKTLKMYGFDHRSIYSKPVKGKHLFGKLFSLGVILISLLQSIILIRQFKPDFVLGVGGFSSFAVVVAARIMGVPCAIQEQNAFPGLTNRRLAPFAGTIFTSFKETRGWAGHPKVRYVGNPVRQTSTDLAGEEHDFETDGNGRITVLVTGGSQGASSINTAFPDALSLMEKRDSMRIIHQTGEKDMELIRKRYADMGVKAWVKAFFHNMPQIQEMADLAITRAGAGIISELCVRGLPAILVPFPFAADDHQTHNARSLEKEGAAILIKDSDLNGQTLKTALESLIFDKHRLEEMSAKLKALATPDAALKIANHILSAKKTKG